MTSTTSLTPLRYDAPTVTLAVMAREAAITQWSDKPVVQIWRYQLQIRDLSNEHPPVEVQGDRTSFLPLMAAVQNYVQAQLTGTVVTATSDRPAAPYLEPLGFTQHVLHWGHLRPAGGDRSLVLGAVQLADLADVLEQLDQAVRPLPVSLVPAAQRPAWRQWGAAAAGIVAAVGVTTVLWPNYQSPPRLETAQDAPTADPVPSTTQPNELAERSPQPSPPDPADGDTAESPAESPSETDVPPEELSAPEGRPADLARSPDNTTAAPAPTAPAPADRPAAAPASPEDAPTNPAPPAAPAARPPASLTPRTAARAPVASSSDSAASGDTADSPETAAGATADATAETFSSEASQNLTTSPETGSLADLVEQVRARWSPPVELDQPLSYTLVLAADGTLVEVIPDGDLAAEYRDRTGIPPTGTVWLSADAPQRVRLRLLPNGRVEFDQELPEP